MSVGVRRAPRFPARGYVPARRRGARLLPEELSAFVRRQTIELAGLLLIALALALALLLFSYSPADPSLNHATAAPPENLLGRPGAVIADLLVQLIGLGVWALVLPLIAWGWLLLHADEMRLSPARRNLRLLTWPLAVIATAAFGAALTPPADWLPGMSMGGMVGRGVSNLVADVLGGFGRGRAHFLTTVSAGLGAIVALSTATGFGARALWRLGQMLVKGMRWLEDRIEFAWKHTEDERRALARWLSNRAVPRLERTLGFEIALPALRRAAAEEPEIEIEVEAPAEAPPRVVRQEPQIKRSAREAREAQTIFDLGEDKPFDLPPLSLLPKTKPRPQAIEVSNEALEQNARLLEAVLDDFGVRGEIIEVRPGPVVTLYELRPAPGIKSSRVVSLADDIARSMSAVSARVAVIPGRNVIGIELPNSRREMVYLRELLSSSEFETAQAPLTLALGKTIGGEPVMADLSTMPHLLIAGTTGSGKSVALNTMILSLIYRLPPSRCRFILVDPKMLELSVYDGIPHLLAPVVTHPKKAVVALKWVVKEMEDRYRKMSKLGVRNVAGFNARLADATAKGEILKRTVQTGFDRETGEPVFEEEIMELEPLPFIVVVVDEMADLMMVAGKEIETAVQRLAQMARAAGIHLITATQRPSVDVITGTIKANFPTRISFQVTSKIDSRTILGEQGAEQLLGEGDMLYMAGGGRIRRVHGPFVTDEEVEAVVKFLKRQAEPVYLDAVTAGDEEDEEEEQDAFGMDESDDELYRDAVEIVARERRVSTSYIQRRLQIGYNRAARLVELMEERGLVTPPNHQGKREILIEERGG
jgi:S-DNA-T family DNA segregation ATPase FtsK/SpoIIIE